MYLTIKLSDSLSPSPSLSLSVYIITYIYIYIYYRERGTNSLVDIDCGPRPDIGGGGPTLTLMFSMVSEHGSGWGQRGSQYSTVILISKTLILQAGAPVAYYVY